MKSGGEVNFAVEAAIILCARFGRRMENIGALGWEVNFSYQQLREQ
jgi:hypothetical protein